MLSLASEIGLDTFDNLVSAHIKTEEENKYDENDLEQPGRKAVAQYPVGLGATVIGIDRKRGGRKKYGHFF